MFAIHLGDSEQYSEEFPMDRVAEEFVDRLSFVNLGGVDVEDEAATQGHWGRQQFVVHCLSNAMFQRVCDWKRELCPASDISMVACVCDIMTAPDLIAFPTFHSDVSEETPENREGLVGGLETTLQRCETMMSADELSAWSMINGHYAYVDPCSQV